MTGKDNKDKILSQTLTKEITVQLVENEHGCFLRILDPEGNIIRQSPPLCSDPVSLMDAREFFPEHLPWAGMAVDGNH
ncbi:MAG: hypothetical protein V2B19_28600 [Pseudomonadota bacterium]